MEWISLAWETSVGENLAAGETCPERWYFLTHGRIMTATKWEYMLIRQELRKVTIIRNQNKDGQD